MSVEALAVIPPEQHERKRFIGGSDISGILGVSPWTSPVKVYYNKTAQDDPNYTPPGKKKLFQRGKMWESVVAEMLVAELRDRGHDVKVIASNRRYRDPDVDYFAAEIDYEIELDGQPDVNVELKTVHPNAAKYWGESDTQDTPIYYYAQGMWGLGVTRRKCVVLAPLFGADEVRVYPIVADQVAIQGMRNRAQNFWTDHVLKRVPPEPTTLADADLLFGSQVKGKVIEADSDLIKIALRYRTALTTMNANEAALLEAEFHLKCAMGDAEAIVVNGKNAFTWKEQTAKRLDQGLIKESYPKIFRECSRESKSRVFRSFQFNGTVEE